MKRLIYSPFGAAIFAVILGLLGGGMSYLLLNGYLLPLNPVPKEITGIVNQSVITAPSDEVRQRLSRQLVRLYTAPQKIAGQTLWTDEELLGYGLTITNNGWLLTAAEPSALSGLWIMDYKQNIYQPTQWVRDDFAGVHYLKIPLDNTVPADFGAPPEATLLNTPLTVTDGRTWWQTVSVNELLAYLPTNQTTETTEHFTRGHRLSQNLINRLQGLPVIDNQGKIIGLVRDNGYLLPSYYFTSRFTELLSTAGIHRPRLKLNYYDLSRVTIDRLFNDRPLTQGAFLTHVGDQTVLKPGDIISGINEQPLDSLSNLTNRLQQFNPGDILRLTVIRAGQSLDLELTLP